MLGKQLIISWFRAGYFRYRLEAGGEQTPPYCGSVGSPKTFVFERLDLSVSELENDAKYAFPNAR